MEVAVRKPFLKHLFLERKVLSKEAVFLLAQVFFFQKRKSVKKALPKK